MRTLEECNWKQSIGADTHENRVNASSAGAFGLIEPNKTKNRFQVCARGVGDANQNGLSKALCAIENQLANVLYDMKNSVSPALAESRKSKNTAANGGDLSRCRANINKEVNASIRTK